MKRESDMLSEQLALDKNVTPGQHFADHCSLLFFNSWHRHALFNSADVSVDHYETVNRASTTLPPLPKSTSPPPPVTWVSWPTTFRPSKLSDRDCWKSLRPAVPRSTSVRRTGKEAGHAGAHSLFIASQSLPVSLPSTATTH